MATDLTVRQVRLFNQFLNFRQIERRRHDFWMTCVLPVLFP